MQIPLERVFIDAISLDQEMQLERELLKEELRPIDAAWDTYDPRATFSQPLPMMIFRPESHWHLSIQHKQFLEALVWRGEVGMGEVMGMVHHLSFRSAWDMLTGGRA